LVFAVPHLLGPHLIVVVSSEFPYFASEPLLRIQEKSTIAITVELHTLIIVVELKVSSPPSDYQVSRWDVSPIHAWVPFVRCIPVLAPRVVVTFAFFRVNCDSFRRTYPSGYGLRDFSLTVWLRIKGVGAIKVATEIIADNWRFFELRSSADVSLVVLVV